MIKHAMAQTSGADSDFLCIYRGRLKVRREFAKSDLLLQAKKAKKRMAPLAIANWREDRESIICNPLLQSAASA
jgi:hypothetical protein